LAKKGEHLSEETKRLISISLKGRRAWNKGLTKETDERVLRQVTKKSTTNMHKPKSESHKKAIGAANKGKLKGRHISEAHRQKIIINHPHLSGEKNPMFGRTGKLNPMYGKRSHSHGQWYINKWTGHPIWLRSTWEVAVSDYLYDNCIIFEYESNTFEIGNTTYTPDFYLIHNDTYIEVKGYMSKVAQTKIDLFKEYYPNIKFELWDMQVLLEKEILQNYLSEEGLKDIKNHELFIKYS
jgi:hypothetical protein